jgi:hypothetical protein
MPFYAVHVSNSGRISQRWSRPLDTASEARQEARRVLRDDTATLAFVVKIGDGERCILPRSVYPESARKIVDHYLELVDALKQERTP